MEKIIKLSLSDGNDGMPRQVSLKTNNSIRGNYLTVLYCLTLSPNNCYYGYTYEVQRKSRIDFPSKSTYVLHILMFKTLDKNSDML